MLHCFLEGRLICQGDCTGGEVIDDLIIREPANGTNGMYVEGWVTMRVFRCWSDALLGINRCTGFVPSLGLSRDVGIHCSAESGLV